MNLYALFTIVLYVFASGTTSAAVSSLELRELTLFDIPECGVRPGTPCNNIRLRFAQLQCLLTNLPVASCSLADINCICESNELSRILSACMLANCTMQDTLGTARVQADLCKLPNESKTQRIILYTSIVYSIAFLFVSVRIASKVLSERLGWDDLVISIALVLTAVPLACILRSAQDGFGKHLWSLQNGKLLFILRYIYISWLLYIIVLCLLKVSLLLFYLKVFAVQAFRRTAYCTLGFILASSSVVFFLTVFACTPVSSFWNRDIKGGTCIDIQALGYALSATAMVQDVILLALPLAFLRHLQMKLSRKIAVGFMFAVGTFGMVATAMRLPSLSTFRISIDPTWDYVAVTEWSQIELVVCFICVSLPQIRVLVARMIPSSVKERFFSKTRSLTGGSLPSSKPKTRKPQQLKISEKQQHSWTRANLTRKLWPQNEPSHIRAGSRRLESASGNYTQRDKDIEMLIICKSEAYK